MAILLALLRDWSTSAHLQVDLLLGQYRTWYSNGARTWFRRFKKWLNYFIMPLALWHLEMLKCSLSLRAGSIGTRSWNIKLQLYTWHKSNIQNLVMRKLEPIPTDFRRKLGYRHYRANTETNFHLESTCLWTVQEKQSTWRKPMRRTGKLHMEWYLWLTQGSHPGSSCCEVTTLTTTSRYLLLTIGIWKKLLEEPDTNGNSI